MWNGRTSTSLIVYGICSVELPFWSQIVIFYVAVAVSNFCIFILQHDLFDAALYMEEQQLFDWILNTVCHNVGCLIWNWCGTCVIQFVAWTSINVARRTSPTTVALIPRTWRPFLTNSAFQATSWMRLSVKRLELLGVACVRVLYSLLASFCMFDAVGWGTWLTRKWMNEWMKTSLFCVAANICI